MERFYYFIRRLLLVIPTFLGITFICFLLCQLVPGGPVEQVLLQMRGIGGAGQGRGADMTRIITEDQRKAVERHFGFDRPIHQRYWKWLVTDRIGMTVDSYKYPNKTVWQLICQRFPVSLMFGVTSFLLTYLICIPLGIAKALKHGQLFDWVSSLIVFAGYSIPPFAFGLLLKMGLSGMIEGGLDLFPVSGLHSPDYAALTPGARLLDTVHHMALPVLCYMVGNFAVLTLLLKNSVLEQIGQDYVRTVLAKGATAQYAVWRHALRNSLIPIATGFGSILTVMFAGSVLIEKVFEIPGMGLLSLDAIVGRDYMLFMGILALTSILGLLGRILSDLSYVLIDPRIHFGK